MELSAMIPSLPNARLCASWQLTVQRFLAGHLDLYECPFGYAWSWEDKPSQLVSLLGVQDEHTPQSWFFTDRDSAIGHLMHCTGIAFRGDCGLVAAGA
jgi:hypothetical protein